MIIVLLSSRHNVVVALANNNNNNDDQNCISELKQIYMAEQQHHAFEAAEASEEEEERHYILCGDTIFTPGTVDPNTGMIPSGQDAPLICYHSHCTISCATENCILDGSTGGTYGIFLMPHLLQDFVAVSSDSDNNNNDSDDSSKIEQMTIRGITVSNWRSPADQIPIVVGGTSGSVVFEDCIFESNQADPLFLLDHYMMNTEDEVALRRRKRRRRQLVASEIMNDDLMLPTPTELLKLSSSSFMTHDDDNHNEKAQQRKEEELYDPRRRHLDESQSLSIEFSSCTFQHNVAPPSEEVQTQGGYSLVRFRGTNPMTSPEDDLVAHDFNANFNNCDFINNTFVSLENQDISLSLIDFYSTGLLTIQNNCFYNSKTQKDGLVTVQSGATILSLGNYKDEQTLVVVAAASEPSSSSSCSSSNTNNFIATMNANYERDDNDDCNNNAASTNNFVNTCRPPTFCFSEKTTVDTLDRGLVSMKDLIVGDYVRVSDTKYEPIYSFGHLNHNDDTRRSITTDFLQIQTMSTSSEGGGVLEMTPNHLIFLSNSNIKKKEEGNHHHHHVVVPASSLVVGDEVVLASGKADTIRSIQKVKRKGIYAPFTPSGMIITNGIQSSIFATLSKDSSLVSFANGTIQIPFLTYHQLGLWFESPHRLYCLFFGITSDNENDYNKETGMSVWLERPMKLFQWFLVLQPSCWMMLVVSGILFFISLMVLILINLLEMMILRMMTTMMSSATILLLLTLLAVVVGYFFRWSLVGIGNKQWNLRFRNRNTKMA